MRGKNFGSPYESLGLDPKVLKLVNILLEMLKPCLLLANIGFIKSRSDDVLINCIRQITSCIFEYLEVVFSDMEMPKMKQDLETPLLQSLWWKFMLKESDFLLRENQAKFYTSRLYQIQLGQFLGGLRTFYTFKWVHSQQDVRKQMEIWMKLKENSSERHYYEDAIMRMEKFLHAHKNGRSGFVSALKTIQHMKKRFNDKLSSIDARHVGGSSVPRHGFPCPLCKQSTDESLNKNQFLRQTSGYSDRNFDGDEDNVENFPVWKNNFREKVKKKLRKIRDEQEKEDREREQRSANRWKKGIRGFLSWALNWEENEEPYEDSGVEYSGSKRYLKGTGMEYESRRKNDNNIQTRLPGRSLRSSWTPEISKRYSVDRLTSDDSSDEDSCLRIKSRYRAADHYYQDSDQSSASY